MSAGAKGCGRPRSLGLSQGETVPWEVVSALLEEIIKPTPDTVLKVPESRSKPTRV